MWADGGYAGRLIVFARKVPAITVEVVKRTDDLAGFTVLPRRWVVERTFAWISTYRRCVRDHETLPEHHETMVNIAMIMTMSQRLARTGDWQPSSKSRSHMIGRGGTRVSAELTAVSGPRSGWCCPGGW